MPANENRPPPENPYASPTSEPSGSRSAPTDSLAERDLRAFVGENADYYLHKWRPLLRRQGTGAGFNWAAFFLFYLWLVYRKMYLVAVAIYAILLMVSIAEDVVFLGFHADTTTPQIAQVVALVAAIVCGAFGNRWYLSYARKAIRKVRSHGLEEDAVAEALAKRGGTSPWLAWTLFVMLFAIEFIRSLFF